MRNFWHAVALIHTIYNVEIMKQFLFDILSFMMRVDIKDARQCPGKLRTVFPTCCVLEMCLKKLVLAYAP